MYSILDGTCKWRRSWIVIITKNLNNVFFVRLKTLILKTSGVELNFIWMGGKAYKEAFTLKNSLNTKCKKTPVSESGFLFEKRNLLLISYYS